MIFLVTRDDEEYGYICKSEDAMSFLACLDDIANETQIRFVKSVEDKELFYLVERRFDEMIEWDVCVIDENEDEYYEDVLYLVAKEDYLEKA